MLRAARRRERRAHRQYRCAWNAEKGQQAAAKIADAATKERLARSIAYMEAYPDDFEEIPF